jgi:hypothetical protein
VNPAILAFVVRVMSTPRRSHGCQRQCHLAAVVSERQFHDVHAQAGSLSSCPPVQAIDWTTWLDGAC